MSRRKRQKYSPPKVTVMDILTGRWLAAWFEVLKADAERLTQRRK